jgi:hypothetical protein
VLDTRNVVSLELETDRPYLHYDEHKVKFKGNGRGAPKDVVKGGGTGGKE